jgi:hypothetical protein
MLLESFHSTSTMLLFVRGHHLLEYYFSVADARVAANDRDQETGSG